MSKKSGTLSKRQALRAQRERKQRQQRMVTIGIVAAIALGLAALLIAPSIIEARTPVGDIVQITPKERPAGTGLALGDPNAPVTIEVFEDFQCPACRSYSSDVEPQVLDNLVATGQAYYVYRQYPFLDDRSPSNESDQAANASMCASEQDRFWDYHDMLFANWNGENQGAFSDKRLVAFAEALGLDMNQFNQCFESNKYRDQIQADLAAGQAYGATGTPSVFINGQQVAPGYVPTFDQINQAVQAAAQGN